MIRIAFAVIASIVITGATASISNAVEIKGLFANGIGVVTRELTPVFERTSGYK